MCGRYTQTKSREEVLQTLGEIELPPLFHGRYNIAPTKKVAVIPSAPSLKADEFIWGFDNPKSSAPIINARAETLHERPMFRNLLNTNRCLIPADGFYEWKGRQPYYFQLPDKQLFAFAGLWRHDRCVIITRAATATMQGIHDRMPVILPTTAWGRWQESFHMPAAPSLIVRPVSQCVNKVATDFPVCIEPDDEQLDLSLFPTGK